MRRLAVQTEDHPIGYIDFEGEIAEGQYGAGTVKIWDEGTYDLEKRNEKTLEIVLHGKRLSGGYVLVHTNADNWLMLKRK